MKYLNVSLPSFARGYLHYLHVTFCMLGLMQIILTVNAYITGYTFSGGPVSGMTLGIVLLLAFVLGPASLAFIEEVVTFILDKIFS